MQVKDFGKGWAIFSHHSKEIRIERDKQTRKYIIKANGISCIANKMAGGAPPSIRERHAELRQKKSFNQNGLVVHDIGNYSASTVLSFIAGYNYTKKRELYILSLI